MNDWDHLRNNFKADNLCLGKVGMKLTFEGSLEAFVAWASETFRDPGPLPVKVVVEFGQTDPVSNIAVDPAFTVLRFIIPDTVSDEKVNLGLIEARRLIRANQKINAIKHLREVGGLGLKEAKDIVENHLIETEIPF